MSIKGTKYGTSSSGEQGFVGIDVALLPRYEFIETGVGCAEHGDPGCLCDVKITTPVEVNCKTLQFATTSLSAVDADCVSERNVYEFAQYLFGACEEHAVLVATGKVSAKRIVGNGHTGKATAWSLLDKTVSDRMREAFKAHVPWKEAKTFLPPDLSIEDVRSIRTYYNQRLFAKNNRKQTVSA